MELDVMCMMYEMVVPTRSFHQNFLINNPPLLAYDHCGSKYGIFNFDYYYTRIWPQKRFIANNSLVIYNLSVICRSFTSLRTVLAHFQLERFTI